MKVARFFGRIFARLLFSTKSVIVLLVLAIAASAAAYYFYSQNQKTLTLLNNPAQASDEEITELTGKVGKFMELPQDERPTIITVVEKEKLKDQPFFSRAENGDKVLVYTGAKKAIMYRTSSNKIIEVGPVDITPNQTFKAAVLYSTGKSTSADTVASTLKEKVSNLEIADKVAAAGTYTKNIVADIKGDKNNEATQLAELIGGEVGTLPAAETKPDADFLVIVGK